MYLLQFSEINPAEGRRQSDGGKPVRALYRVTEADKRTSHGKAYTWDSLVAAVDNSQLQEDIRLGLVVGYLDHPGEVYDKAGHAVASNPKSNPKLFRVDSMWADEATKSILAWVEYFDNAQGLYWSDQIRQGQYPKVSMVSSLRCDSKNVCDVLAIENFDQVSVPAMQSAVMLQYKDSANSNQVIKQQDCQCSAGVSRSAAIRTGDAKMKIQLKPLRQKDLMSLEEILGQAKLGWLSAEAIVCLEVWCERVEEMMTAASSAAASATTSADAELETDAAKLNGDAVKMLGIIRKINEAQSAHKATDSALKDAAANIAKAKAATAAASTQSTQQTDSALLARLDALEADNKALKAEKAQDAAKSDAQQKKSAVKDAVEKLFSGDSIAFGEGDAAIHYQRANFAADELAIARDAAMRGKSPEDAIELARVSFDSISRMKAGKYLAGKGYHGDAPDAKGKTAGVQLMSNPQPGREILDKMKDANLAYARQNDPKGYTEMQRAADCKIIKERVSDLRLKTQPKIDRLLRVGDQLMAGRAKDSASELDSMGIMEYMDLFPTERAKDAGGIALTNASNAVIVPHFAAFMLEQEFEQLNGMNYYRGITDAGLVGLPQNSEGFGRVYNFGKELVNEPLGDDPDLELATDGETVFDEMTIRTGRQEFVAKDFGLVVRFARGDAAALKASDIMYDVLARLQYRSNQRLARRRNTRMLRLLFDAWEQAYATAKTTEDVANIAPSGAGPKSFTGEYKRGPAGTAFAIGGKTFGGTGSNIEAAARALGDQTTNTSFANISIVRPTTQNAHDQNGDITAQALNPIVVKVGGVTKTRGRYAVVAGVQMILPRPGQTDAHWAEDLDGFILLSDTSGVGADPTSPQINLKYDYVPSAKIKWFNQAEGNDDVAKHFNKYLYLCADIASELYSTPNFAMATAVLMSHKFGTQVRKASKFDTQESPRGTNLNNVYSTDLAVGAYGTLDFLADNGELPHGDSRSLVFQPGYAAAAMFIDEISSPYRAKKTNLLTGQQQTLPQLVMDIMHQDCLGVPLLKHPDTGDIFNFPFQCIRHYGTLQSAAF